VTTNTLYKSKALSESQEIWEIRRGGSPGTSFTYANMRIIGLPAMISKHHARRILQNTQALAPCRNGIYGTHNPRQPNQDPMQKHFLQLWNAFGTAISPGTVKQGPEARCRMGARTGSKLIELSEDSMGRSPLFIYCSGDRSSCIAIATSIVG
jgi:hypothetical protein